MNVGKILLNEIKAGDICAYKKKVGDMKYRLQEKTQRHISHHTCFGTHRLKLFNYPPGERAQGIRHTTRRSA